MKITLEADYAVRIVNFLSKNSLASASDISNGVGVSQRFTLKILRKLSLSGLLGAKKGVSGGYYLISAPENITLLSVIEAIDGNICLNRCGADDTPCSRMGDNKTACRFHIIFKQISDMVREQLGSYTFADENKENGGI